MQTYNLDLKQQRCDDDAQEQQLARFIESKLSQLRGNIRRTEDLLLQPVGR